MSAHDPAELLANSGKAATAVQQLRARMAQGDASAALLLAQWLMQGVHLARNISQARETFALAERLGAPDARLPLCCLLGSGAGGLTRHWPDALARFAQLAASDRVLALQAQALAAMTLDPHGNPTTIYAPEFLCQDPLIVRFQNFMTAQECDALIDAAQPRMAPATVVHPSSGALVRDPIRDSSAAAFPFLDENPFIHALNRRIAKASRSAPEQGEPMQVLAYGPNQQYRLHSDAIAGAANQRIQTFLVYLTDDFTGGATYFPEPDLALRPARGDAICFSNVMSDFRPAHSAQHAGLPVESGTKIIMSKWIRQRPLDLSGPRLRPR